MPPRLLRRQRRFTSGAAGPRFRLYGVTEADVIRWTGVIVGVFGAIVVAPSGAKLILLDAWAVLLDAWASIRRAWNRFIRRKKEPAPAVRAEAGLAVAFGVTARASVVRTTVHRRRYRSASYGMRLTALTGGSVRPRRTAGTGMIRL